LFHYRPCWLRRGVATSLCVGTRASFVIKEMMQVHPEAAVKFENGERPVSRFDLLRGRVWRHKAKQKAQEQGDGRARKRPVHSGSGNGNATFLVLKLSLFTDSRMPLSLQRRLESRSAARSIIAPNILRPTRLTICRVWLAAERLFV
jgi:hypothetical protein